MAKRNLLKLTPAQRTRVIRMRDDAHEDASLIAKLETAIELHLFATWYEPPSRGGIDGYRRVYQDPRCDLGTASLIYWKLCCDSLASKIDYRDDLTEIERRMAEGFYREHDIRFDPRIDPADPVEVCGRAIPAELLAATPGTEADASPIAQLDPSAYRSELLSRTVPADEQALLSAIARRPEEDISDHIDRLWAERIRLLELGKKGISVWLRHEKVDFDELHEIGRQPPSAKCPWQFAPETPPRAIVEAVFAPLAAKLPTSIARLGSNCRRVFTLRCRDRWYLLYAVSYEGKIPTVRLLAGGPPVAKPVLPESVSALGWKLPKSLRAFYSVHDGFGECSDLFGRAPCDIVPPCARLSTLAEVLDDDAIAGEELPYSPSDLLEFFPDGAGNGEYFHRRSRTDADPPVRDWDHETWKLSEPDEFFGFLDRRLVRISDKRED